MVIVRRVVAVALFACATVLFLPASAFAIIGLILAGLGSLLWSWPDATERRARVDRGRALIDAASAKAEAALRDAQRRHGFEPRAGHES